MKTPPALREPDTTKNLAVSKQRDVVVLKKDRSLAIVNKDGKSNIFVISQVHEAPIYVKVRPFQTATFRNILSSDSKSVIVTDMPYAKMENFLGRPRVMPHFSFYFNDDRTDAKSH